jgi:hypothetical protein
MARILFLYCNVKITAHVEYLKIVCLYINKITNQYTFY